VVVGMALKKLKFVKVKCQCGYTNLIPAYENVKCEKCGRVIAGQKE
jgi:ribosomal protein S27E